MAKVYLSPAAHTTDNKTKCPSKCGENVHCNAYMDIVEKRLKELGFEVKRGSKTATGGNELSRRVTEANRWKADIYYAEHTNADGKNGETGANYSMTMHFPSKDSEEKAEVFHKYRKCIAVHKVVPRSDLFEINATNMVCIYDELFFHDNEAQCKWFHNGGMELLAEETVQALCEICDMQYAPVNDKSTINTDAVSGGKLTVKEWQKAAIADGYKFPVYGADGEWGAECESVAKKAVVKKRLFYTNKNLTKLVQKVVGVTADGLCGNATVAAIKAWQKKNGLIVDGCVGINSWKKMLGV